MSDTNESPRIQGDTGAVEFNVHPTIEDDAIESLMHLIDKGALITPSDFYSLVSETVIRWRLDAACMVVTGTRTLYLSFGYLLS